MPRTLTFANSTMDTPVKVEIESPFDQIGQFDPLNSTASEELRLTAAIFGPAAREQSSPYALGRQLRVAYPPVASFKEVAANLQAPECRMRLASTLIEPYLGRPALAKRILAEFVREGLDPYASSREHPDYSEDCEFYVGGGGVAAWGPSEWPCVIAATLGTDLRISTDSIKKLADACRRFNLVRNWVEGILSTYVFSLRQAGLTPLERVKFGVEVLNGLQVKKEVNGVEIVYKHVKNPDGTWTKQVSTYKAKWSPIALVPLPALVLAKVNQGLRERTMEPIMGEKLLAPHESLTRAGIQNMADLLENLEIKANKATIQRRMEFARRFDAVLDGMGAYAGLDRTVGNPADRAVIDHAEGATGPVPQAQVDGLWVFEHLLGDRDLEIRRFALGALARIRYGRHRDGLAILRNGGEGAYPFGIERVMQDAIAQDNKLVEQSA